MAARRGLQRDFGRSVAGVFQERTAYRLRDQRRAFPDLDGYAPAPSVCPLFSRRVRGARISYFGVEEGVRHPGRRPLAGAHGAQREVRSPDPPPLLRSRAGAHGFAPSGHAGAREHQARCAEDRFCAPFRHLQTGVAALHRSGSPGGHRQQQGASRAVYLCGQGASQRSAGTGSHQADHRSRSHAAVLRQDHLPAELRHGAGASPGAGRGRVAQYPYSSARGVGYVG